MRIPLPNEQQRQPAPLDAFSIRFYFLSYLLFCIARRVCYCFRCSEFFVSLSMKGFHVQWRTREMCSLFFFLSSSVSIVNCQWKNARKSCRSSYTQSNAQKRRKSRKIVKRRQEIFERFMNLCICYTLCCAKTTCFGIRRAVFVVFFSPFGLLTHNKEATAKKIAWITSPKIT